MEEKRCEECESWTQNTFFEYENAVNYGKCEKIKNELTIEIIAGYNGGYVDNIETESVFCCSCFAYKF